MVRKRQGQSASEPGARKAKLGAGRRSFLTHAGAIIGGALVAPPGFATDAATPGCGVTTKLMHDHGLILRVLLIYGAFRDRLNEGNNPDPKLLTPVLNLVSTAVHGYHERVEEEVVFERLRGEDAHEEVISRLAGQHSIGRELTATIGRGADPGSGRALGNDRFAEALNDFIVLYAPHEAREDTVIFPAFQKQVSADEMAAMQEGTAKRERKVLGEDWFPQAVQQVAEVERALGIHELQVREPT